MRLAYVTAGAALRCRQAHSADAVEVGRCDEFVALFTRAPDSIAWPTSKRRAVSCLDRRIAAQAAVESSVLSPTTITAYASAAKPARTTSLRERRRTMRACDGGSASCRARLRRCRAGPA